MLCDPKGHLRLGLARSATSFNQAREAGNRRNEFSWFDWLRKMRLIPRPKGAHAILGSCVGGERDSRSGAAGIRRTLPDAPHQIVAINIWQSDVTHHDIHLFARES